MDEILEAVPIGQLCIRCCPNRGSRCLEDAFLPVVEIHRKALGEAGIVLERGFELLSHFGQLLGGHSCIDPAILEELTLCCVRVKLAGDALLGVLDDFWVGLGLVRLGRRHVAEPSLSSTELAMGEVERS